MQVFDDILSTYFRNQSINRNLASFYNHFFENGNRHISSKAHKLCIMLICASQDFTPKGYFLIFNYCVAACKPFGASAFILVAAALLQTAHAAGLKKSLMNSDQQDWAGGVAASEGYACHARMQAHRLDSFTGYLP
jgi:hypothetical protein